MFMCKLGKLLYLIDNRKMTRCQIQHCYIIGIRELTIATKASVGNTSHFEILKVTVLMSCTLTKVASNAP